MGTRLWAMAVLALALGVAAAGEVRLEASFYYDGNVDDAQWGGHAALAVAPDGTIAVACTGNIGAGNEPGTHRARILLYDKAGTPLAEIPCASNTGLASIKFGPDGMLYTAENWFGAGAHVYDRPGWKNHFVAKRRLIADGANVDRGSPSDLAFTPDGKLYTDFGDRVCLLTTDDALVATYPTSNDGTLHTDPAGTLYSGNKVLDVAAKTWKPFKYYVMDIAGDGRMLVRDPGGWAIYNPATDTVEKHGKYPAGLDVAQAALTPDGGVCVTAYDKGLAFAAIDADGHILFQRGADYDRLRAVLPADAYTAGGTVVFTAETIRSRALGMVPPDRILPQDNRPVLALTAWMAPPLRDPLGERVWSHLLLFQLDESHYKLILPAGLAGPFTLRLAATPTDIPGSKPLAVTAEISVAQPGQAAYLQPQTDRGRTAFAPGTPVRLTVPVAPTAAVDLSAARLELRRDGRALWTAPLGVGAVAAGQTQTAVVTIPAEVTARLKPGFYTAALAGLPAGVLGGNAPVALTDPVRPEAFQTPAHTIGPTYQQPVNDACLQAAWGATHVTASAQYDPLYLDTLARCGVDANYQLYGHYSAVHTLPQEQGALQVWAAGWAQRLEAFPACTGITFHDLQVQEWGGWWDAPRKPYYDNELWPKWAREVPVPATVPEANKGNWATAHAVEGMLTRMYAKLNGAIAAANPALGRTTMQWWHQPLYIADPDDVATGQTLITAQHMEEQYYHPLSVANMADLWRRPDKDIWVYGNNSWQEDGTGAMSYTDLMAALFRGVQGAGRNQAPQTADMSSEFGTRVLTPAFRLWHRYGGISAVAHPADQVAVWRSMFQESLEYPGRRSEEMHMTNMAAAYTACLYSHYTAGIVTDDLVRVGGLGRYKAVIISFEAPLPDALLQPLLAFQKAGGLVLANTPAHGYWAPPGALALGPAFREAHILGNNNRDSLRHLGIQDDGLKGAAVLQGVLAGKLAPQVDCDNPAVWTSLHTAGAARYVWAVNDTILPQRPLDLHHYTGYENTRLPVKAVLRVPAGKYVVYDVLAGKRVTPGKAGDRLTLTADMTVFPGALFALLPEEIAGVRVAAGEHKPAVGAWTLAVRVEVLGAGGKPIKAAVPVELTVHDAAGTVRYAVTRTAVDGVCAMELPVAANDAPGAWQVTARELFAGRSLTAALTVAVPGLPAAAPTPAVEWGRASRAAQALKLAHTVAVIAAGPSPTADRLAAALTNSGKQVTRLDAKEYLADLATLHWTGFPDRHGVNGDFGKIVPRDRKYDLVVTLDTPQAPTGVVKADLLPIAPSVSDPGPGRGLVQFVTMPVYNDEDAVALFGGDVPGLEKAVDALLAGTPQAVPAARFAVAKNPLRGKAGQSMPPALPDFLGLHVHELAVSGDGTRIAAGLEGWGNNVVVLSAAGDVFGKEMSGKFFPRELQAVGDGFAVISHENDPTTEYLKLYDHDGRPTMRLAAMGRRVGGVRDCTPNFPVVMNAKFLPQAAFSLGGGLAAVAGSNGLAVWELAKRTLLWRDDTAHYNAPQVSGTAWADVDSFPQLRLSPDGAGLIVQHNGAVTVRDAHTGVVRGTLALPPGSAGGRVQLFDGVRLVIGDGDYFGFTLADGKALPLWHFKAPKTVTASVFCADGLRYATGEVDGTLRIMQGGGQIGGFSTPAPGSAIASLDALPSFFRVAFATTSGLVGVLDNQGYPRWTAQVSAPATIRFLGADGATVVGDGRGILHWFAPDGADTRQLALTPLVWRDDLGVALTTPDTTPTLRPGPSPEEATPAPVPAGRDNQARTATFTYVVGRGWWGEPVNPARSVSLNDGKKDAPPNGWFDRNDLENLSFVPGPCGWEIAWQTPVTVDTLVAYETPPTPGVGIPQEVRVEAWLDNNWHEVAHCYWNTQATHVHHFAPVTTTKLRYVPLGDLSGGVYLGEIEVY